MDIVGRFTGQLFWLNLCDQLERDPIMDDSPPPYRQRMSSVEGARQLVQWYGADVTHQLLEVEEIKKIWDPQSKHFLPFSKSYFGRWDFIMASATLQVMHDKTRPSVDDLADFNTTIPDRQVMWHMRHASSVGFFWSSVIVFVASWLFLRQTDSEFCQREIKMAGGWKKLSSCLRPRWKRLSSQLLLLLVTSCGQRPVSGYSTVSHHFSPSNG